MDLHQAFLQELDMEMVSTRKTLERVPEKMDWTPHPKSMTMGRLAQHLADIPEWVTKTIELDDLDLAPVGAPPHKPQIAKTTKEALATFDRNLAAARAALSSTSDAHLMKPWSLKMGGKTVMTLPRAAVLRNFVLNHNVHHRAQMGVYLRLNDIPVPSVYGPSADEGNM
jgi:uncharacterized damage-inducible protein DinB